MRAILLIVGCLLFLTASVAAQPGLAIVPKPADMQPLAGTFEVNGKTRILADDGETQFVQLVFVGHVRDFHPAQRLLRFHFLAVHELDDGQLLPRDVRDHVETELARPLDARALERDV